MGSPSSSTDLIDLSEFEDTQKNSCPELTPPDDFDLTPDVTKVQSGVRFEYDELFDFGDEPTLEEVVSGAPDTLDEVGRDDYESFLPDDPEELLEEDMELLPPDTVENAPIFTKESECFFRFLYENRLIGKKRKNHIGISLDDGSKFDVVSDDQNEIKFECDIPIMVKDDICGVRCFDMQFSAVSGECYRFSWHDVCFYKRGTLEKTEFDKVASQIPDPEWQEILKKFSDAFKDGN